MVDMELYGMWPGMHHLTNVILHALNAVLLFLLLSWCTGAVWKSAAVAALFAVHPLHVESVAWIADRKDALSTLFWLLTMLGYVWYVRSTSLARYMTMATSFSLGLMAKPMLVTLPFVLLLFDFWPLQRSGMVRKRGEPGQAERPWMTRVRWSGLAPLAVEKPPCSP